MKNKQYSFIQAYSILKAFFIKHIFIIRNISYLKTNALKDILLQKNRLGAAKIRNTSLMQNPQKCKLYTKKGFTNVL